jgi:putative phosphonate metabolism protein
MSGPRYAVYFAPLPDSDLWRFGSAAIGYDAATGAELPIPPVEGFSDDALLAATADPRLYGFHATLKPPFHLDAGVTEDDLMRAVAAFAAVRAPFTLPGLGVNALGAFIALTPDGRPADLHALADDCVRDFDRLRAPLTAADRARRLASPLTPRHIEQLDRWGYPYVFEDFRFHMTLSGRLDEAARETLLAALRARWAPLSRPVAIDAVTVFVQPERTGRFRILARMPFGGVA